MDGHHMLSIYETLIIVIKYQIYISSHIEKSTKFSQILQRLPKITSTSSSNSHFGDTSPLKVQVSFDSSVFEDQINADSLEK
jgi:hypothetical protein